MHISNRTSCTHAHPPPLDCGSPTSGCAVPPSREIVDTIVSAQFLVHTVLPLEALCLLVGAKHSQRGGNRHEADKRTQLAEALKEVVNLS